MGVKSEYSWMLSMQDFISKPLKSVRDNTLKYLSNITDSFKASEKNVFKANSSLNITVSSLTKTIDNLNKKSLSNDFGLDYKKGIAELNNFNKAILGFEQTFGKSMVNSKEAYNLFYESVNVKKLDGVFKAISEGSIETAVDIVSGFKNTLGEMPKIMSKKLTESLLELSPSMLGNFIKELGVTIDKKTEQMLSKDNKVFNRKIILDVLAAPMKKNWADLPAKEAGLALGIKIRENVTEGLKSALTKSGKFIDSRLGGIPSTIIKGLDKGFKGFQFSGTLIKGLLPSVFKNKGISDDSKKPMSEKIGDAAGGFGTIGAIIKAVLQVASKISPMVILFDTLFQAIEPFTKTLKDILMPLFVPLSNFLVQVAEAMRPLVDSLLPPIAELFKALTPVFVALTKGLKPVFDLLGWAISGLAKIITYLTNFDFSNFFKSFGKLWLDIQLFIPRMLWKALTKLVDFFFPGLTEKIGKWFSNVFNIIPNFFKGIMKWVRSTWIGRKLFGDGKDEEPEKPKSVPVVKEVSKPEKDYSKYLVSRDTFNKMSFVDKLKTMKNISDIRAGKEPTFKLASDIRNQRDETKQKEPQYNIQPKVAVVIPKQDNTEITKTFKDVGKEIVKSQNKNAIDPESFRKINPDLISKLRYA